MSCGKLTVLRLGDSNVWIKLAVVLSNKLLRMRGVKGALVVLLSVCTITRSSNTVKT
jgi:hypothetical protein